MRRLCPMNASILDGEIAGCDQYGSRCAKSRGGVLRIFAKTRLSFPCPLPLHPATSSQVKLCPASKVSGDAHSQHRSRSPTDCWANLPDRNNASNCACIIKRLGFALRSVSLTANVLLRSGFFASLTPLVVAVAICRAATLDLHVQDEQNQALPCRVLVRPVGGPCAIPPDAVEVPNGPDRWFVSPGHSLLEVAPGDIELRVERGPEYTRVKKQLRVEAAATSHTVTLPRWIDMRERGYLCGENHVHVPFEQLAPMFVAEGLDFGTMLHWWNVRRLPVADGPNVRNVEFAGRSVPTSVYDAEVEHDWGAMLLTNLPAPHTVPPDRYIPNLVHVKEAHRLGALVHYQAGWSREVGLDALLGYVDVVNVCNNNFHLHRFQPRTQYSNLLETPDLPTYENTPEDMMRMNTDTYYRLLNWGLRLAAGAESATGAKQTVVGYNRAYVRIDPGATIDEFYDSWRAGRNFVTNGPMIFLEAGDAKQPGDTIAFPAAGGDLKVKVKALADQPLSTIEVVQNGKVIQAFKPQSATAGEGEATIPITEGCWIAARCVVYDQLLSDQELAAFANGKAEQPSRLRYAHTSPIYVTVNGKGAAVRDSIAEGRRMLDQMETFARRECGEAYLQLTLEAIEAARLRLQSLHGA